MPAEDSDTYLRKTGKKVQKIYLTPEDPPRLCLKFFTFNFLTPVSLVLDGVLDILMLWLYNVHPAGVAGHPAGIAEHPAGVAR